MSMCAQLQKTQEITNQVRQSTEKLSSKLQQARDKLEDDLNETRSVVKELKDFLSGTTVLGLQHEWNHFEMEGETSLGVTDAEISHPLNTTTV